MTTPENRDALAALVRNDDASSEGSSSEFPRWSGEPDDLPTAPAREVTFIPITKEGTRGQQSNPNTTLPASVDAAPPPGAEPAAPDPTPPGFWFAYDWDYSAYPIAAFGNELDARRFADEQGYGQVMFWPFGKTWDDVKP